MLMGCPELAEPVRGRSLGERQKDEEGTGEGFE